MNTSDIYSSDLVARLMPYAPGEQLRSVAGLIKLNTNENPYPPAPSVIAALRAACDASLRLYPDPESFDLRCAIARYHGVEPGNVFVGNGSDEVLAHIFCGLLKHDRPIVLPELTYSFYTSTCKLFDIAHETISVDEAGQIDVAALRGMMGGIVLANPNPPTGTILAPEIVENLARTHSHCVLVVDEAYVDFGGASFVPHVLANPNTVVVRTFSKSRSLAGMRLGYAIAHTSLIDSLQRVKNSFNAYPVHALAAVAGMASLADDGYFRTTCDRICATRQTMRDKLRNLGFRVPNSLANFMLATHARLDGQRLFTSLRNQHILVRHFSTPRLANSLRISVGTDAEAETLIRTLEKICVSENG